MEMATLAPPSKRAFLVSSLKTGRLVHTATGELEATLELPEGVRLIEVTREYLRGIGKSPALAETFHFQGLQFARGR